MTKRWLLVALVAVAGCRGRVKPDAAEGFGPKVVRLDGTYGVERGGIIEPVLKVELTKTGYVFEERPHGEWETDPETPRTATEDDVRQGLGGAVPGVPVFGLVTGRMMLVKLPAGWRSGGGPAGLASGAGQAVVTKSGYLIVSGGEMVAAEKVELGKR